MNTALRSTLAALAFSAAGLAQAQTSLRDQEIAQCLPGELATEARLQAVLLRLQND